MKLWTTLAAALAFVVGFSLPAAAIVSAWDVVWLDSGTSCTIGRASIQTSTGNVGSTVRSKVTCSESVADFNLPSNRMGVWTYALDEYGGLCGSAPAWVYNGTGTAHRSVAAAVVCSHMDVIGYARQWRKTGPETSVEDWNQTAPLYFP